MQSTLRYAVALVILVVIVGSIAWLVQYLPSRSANQPSGGKPDPETKALAFVRDVALWGKTLAEVKKGLSPEAKDAYPFKYVETGDKGHYDFVFKNTSDADIEIVSYFSSCDCTGVQACSLSSAVWEVVAKANRDKPPEPLPYPQEPTWRKLFVDRNRDGTPESKPDLIIKPSEGGAIRVEWNVNKAPGTPFGIEPMILYRTVGTAALARDAILRIPLKIVAPIHFDTQRIDLRSLRRGESASHTFIAWSATREKVDFKLAPPSDEPLFTIETAPITGADLVAQQEDLLRRQIATGVLSAYRVTVTAHESKGIAQLEQGIFYRKWPIKIDGKIDVAAPLWGPEIVGRVEEEIAVGGADDQGKIKFGSVDLRQTGIVKPVPLATPADMALEVYRDENNNLHPHQPSWVEVRLTRDKEQLSKERTTWVLEVELRRNAKGATSFAEPNAIVLRIVGTKRIVRIPLDGHISS